MKEMGSSVLKKVPESSPLTISLTTHRPELSPVVGHT